MGNIIYYFTGTGNSLQIAKCLSSELGDTEIVRICKKNMNVSSNKEYERIGFVFPVYYRGLPKMFAEFIKNLKIENNVYIFAVADYGGASSLVFEQINSLLKEKGTKLSSSFEMAMPGNMWFMYYPHSKQVILDRIATQEVRTSAIAKEVQIKAIVECNGVTDKDNEQDIYRQIMDVAERDRGFWCDENCIGCGICSKICPAENIAIEKGKPEWKHQCEYCLACIHWCPQKSIQFENITQNRDRYHNPSVKVQELFMNWHIAK